MKKIIALVLSVAMVMGLAACGGSKPAETTKAPETQAATTQAETTKAPETEAPETEDNGASFTLSVNTPQPAESGAGKLLAETCAALTEQSGGRLNFDIYYSGQLLSVFDTVSGVSTGIADIAFLPTSTNPDFFPINGKLLILPFLGMPSDNSIMDVYAQLCEEFPEIEAEVEAQNMRTLSTFFFPREDLYLTSADKTVTSPADLAGLKIAVTNAYVGNLINNNGGAPVTVTQGDVYTTVESGVVDGLIHHDSFIRAGGAVELFQTEVRFGDQGMVREMGKFFMNQDSYNQLPASLKEMLDTAFQELAIKIMGVDVKISEGVQGELNGKGATVTVLTADQVKPFEEAALEVHKGCIDELTGLGLPAQEIYDRIGELCK